MRLVIMILTLAVAMFAAACSESRSEPSAEELRTAVEAYYERLGAGEGELEIDADFVKPRSDSQPKSQDKAKENNDESGEEDRQVGTDCPELEVTIRDSEGTPRSRTVRVPCEVIDEAREELSASLERMRRVLGELSDSARRELSGLVMESVVNAEKLACVPADAKPGYVCDVEATLVYGDSTEEMRFLTARFVQGGDGDWRALEVEEHR